MRKRSVARFSFFFFSFYIDWRNTLYGFVRTKCILFSDRMDLEFTVSQSIDYSTLKCFGIVLSRLHVRPILLSKFRSLFCTTFGKEKHRFQGWNIYRYKEKTFHLSFYVEVRKACFIRTRGEKTKKNKSDATKPRSISWEKKEKLSSNDASKEVVSNDKRGFSLRIWEDALKVKSSFFMVIVFEWSLLLINEAFYTNFILV